MVVQATQQITAKKRSFSPHRSFIPFCLLPLLFIISVGVLYSAHFQRIENPSFLFKHWGTGDGLPQNSILCMAREPSGYLWFGTQSGLVRFDGTVFRVFDRHNTPALKADVITALYTDRDGTVWVGSDGGGLCSYSAGTWRNYSAKDGLTDPSVRVLTGTSDKSIWIGTANGLFRLHKNNVSNINTGDGYWGNVITALAPSSDGAIWVGTYDNGLRRIKMDRLVADTPKGLPEGKEVTALCESRGGELWIGTEAGLFVLNKGQISLAVTAEHPLARHAVRSLLWDHRGSLWVGTDGEGIYRAEIGSPDTPAVNEPEFRQLELPYEIRSDFMTALIEGGEGEYWLGTYSGGLHQLTRPRVTNIVSVSPTRRQRIRTLVAHTNGDMWVGTETLGILRFPTQSLVESALSPSGFLLNGKHAPINALAVAPNGDTWFAPDNNGVVRIHKGTTYRYEKKSGLSHPQVTVILPEREPTETVWIGTVDGLNRFRDGVFTVYAQKDDAQRNASHIITICRDATGRLWVGTRAGLYYMDRERLQPYPDAEGKVNINKETNNESNNESNNEINNEINKDSKKDINKGKKKDKGNPDDGGSIYKTLKGEITAIYADAHQGLWVGTNGGGLVYIPPHRQTQTLYTGDSGLPGNHIFSILEDEQGFLWFGSFKGVFRIARRQLLRFADGEISFVSPVLLDEADGMAASECLKEGRPVAQKRSDGTLWFATTKGISIIDPAGLPLNETAPAVVIEKVTINHRKLEPAAHHVLESEPGLIHIHFAALGFRAAHKIRYHCRLSGPENRDVFLNGDVPRMTAYDRLPPGDYRFTVTACNNDGLWNTEGASVSFSIGSRFYQKAWVLLLIIVVAVVAVVSASVLHRRRRRKTALQLAAAQPPTAAPPELKNTPERKYTTSALQQETVDQTLPRLDDWIESKKIYLDADLTLKKLAEKLNVHYNHLSQIINEHKQQSFNDYINSHRIEEAKKRLSDSRDAHKTILQIAYDTGFYSKSVFNTAFKKFTGKTPSQFRKERQGEK